MTTASSELFDKWGRPKRVTIADTPDFGQPEIRCDNEGWGQWESKALQAKFKDSYDTNRQFRYGNWVVHLNGGPQASEESWASVAVPINDMKVTDILSIEYDWYAHQLGTSHILDIGPNLVFSAYDPSDHAKRVDFNTYGIDNNIFMSDGAANRPIEAGWYKYKMTHKDATERVYYWANNDGTHTPCVTDGADYYWSQYHTDTVFKNWVVYRVQIMIGYWGSTRSTGDVWIGNLRINGVPVNWEPSEAEKIQIAKREDEMFGEPILLGGGEGKAMWEAGWHYGASSRAGSGFVARLIGGKQTSWDDFAKIRIPVNNMHVPDLKTLKWQWFQENTESYGVNVGIHVHDPFDFDKEAEISQLPSISGLDKLAGYNSHELNPSTDQFFFYGTSTNCSLTTGEGPPNYYGWDDFVADEQFNTWVIDWIVLNYGCQTGDAVFDDVIVYLLEINGRNIPLKPSLAQMALEKHYVDNDIPISSGIYTPRRIHVKPQFDLYGTSAGHGIGHLVRGATYGIDNQIGYAIMLGSNAAGTNVNTCVFPVNIQLNKIHDMSYLEKMSQATQGQDLQRIYLRLDADRSGSYEPHNDTDGDFYLGNTDTSLTSATTWTKRNPFASEKYVLKRWHTGAATPDAAIAKDAQDAFADFQATDLGDYWVKEIGWAYCGAAAGDWGMVTSICINGIEYVFDLDPHDAIRHYYLETSADLDQWLITPMTPFRLLSVDVHSDGVLATGELFTVIKDAGQGTSFDTVLLSEDLFIGSRTSYHAVFGEGYEFAADDVIEIDNANGGTDTIGVDVAIEIL